MIYIYVSHAIMFVLFLIIIVFIPFTDLLMSGESTKEKSNNDGEMFVNILALKDSLSVEEIETLYDDGFEFILENGKVSDIVYAGIKGAEK